MWGWTRWAGPNSGALLIEQRVMPLFKKKDPKEQVSRPWGDLDGGTAVCDHTRLSPPCH